MLRLTALLALCLSLPAFAQPLQQAQTPEGYRYGWIGAMPKKPAATVLFLGGQVEYNITDPQYAGAVKALCQKVLCLTIDGPGEGADVTDPKVQSLNLWAQRLATNKDFMGDFTRRAGVVLDRLVKGGAIDPARIGVFGTSRGAFAGFHLASADPRIKAVAAFVPVTDLSVLTEFDKIRPAARKYTAASRAKFAAKLYQRPIWMTIGTADDRVGTQQAIDFSQTMLKSAAAKGVPSVFELHVRPSDGHTAPDGAYAEASAWMLKQLAPATTPVKAHTQ
jgi:dienelactone hydrolase